ncbi:molybdenum cofactor cytidylyltransferase [Lutimaribacter pacificus]|uniref:Molybdenum cofactor cytidylyltransferase n=1 Tax=Lutimaribacter pacificus TaxID=391948 RepID=A0A1H0AS80_9RHOB|nr:molybdopterin-binding protein [Lutimaribacter pacificus]SDN36388.1 molybdenum cofactor cytidylyltransferase [Lutimaribacter pacificus]SHJ65504.1 molybdenum cofactor cytidylyltransferase [Lutimaribacter pacificus]
MRFGPVPLEQAPGAVLAHSLTLPQGRIAKGRVLTGDDIARLRAAGIAEVIVAQLDPGDVAEDAAALALAQALVPDLPAQGLRLSGAGAGRVNLIADGPGLLRVDTTAVNALNAVDPMITLATLPPLRRVVQGAMVATVKIISYAVPRDALKNACTSARAALSLIAPVLETVTLIETRVGDALPPDKGRRATAERVARLGARLTPRTVVPHEETALADAIAAAGGQAILILTASATSDVADVAPAALRRAGGTVTRFGMPVDPGNLLFIGRAADARPVVGLPGCARSPALNGADWVLERVLCGLDVTGADIAAMGLGGLLKEMPTRPRPRRAPGG